MAIVVEDWEICVRDRDGRRNIELKKEIGKEIVVAKERVKKRGPADKKKKN
jgi:hypothetical protein